MAEPPRYSSGPRVWGFAFLATLLALSAGLNIRLLSRRALSSPDADRAGSAPPLRAQDHVRGSGTALLVVYADFQCPFCSELHQSLRALGQTERFRWVLRHRPLSGHAGAERCAEASECAGRQRRFWEYADDLYSAPVADEDVAIDKLVARALRLGMNATEFRRCLVEGEPLARVAADVHEADQLGIRSTPTFFLDGRRFAGAVSKLELRALLRGSTLD